LPTASVKHEDPVIEICLLSQNVMFNYAAFNDCF